FHVTGVQTCALPIFGQEAGPELVVVAGVDVEARGDPAPAALGLAEILRRLAVAKLGDQAGGRTGLAGHAVDPDLAVDIGGGRGQIGRASCRERVWDR